MKKIFLIFILAIPQSISTSASIPTLRLGTDYGGWTIPINLLNEDSICYCVGAGEDISFDVSLVERYGCHVFTVDPTPRAITHFNYIKDAVAAGKKAFINNNPTATYDLKPATLTLMHFLPYGVWNENITMKFFSPKNSSHVSHSILNLQKTENYFEAQCKTISTIMKELGHNHIDLLKLDIEGAEYAVLDSIIAKGLDITCICVEFDEFAGANRVSAQEMPAAIARANQRIKMLEKHGYTLIHQNTFTDMTFLKTQQQD